MDAVKIEEVDDASWEGQAMRKICSDNRGHLSVSPCKLGKCRVMLTKCREAASISRLTAVRFQ
jgi:hypothetical protein